MEEYTREEYLTIGTNANEDLILVMDLTKFHQEECLNALLKNKGDIVNTAVTLTM